MKFIHIIVMIAILSSFIHCSCTTASEEISTESTCSTETSFYENSNEHEYKQTNKELFIDKYGYDIDIYDCLYVNDLYFKLLNNPIDQWAERQCSISMTTDEMLKCEAVLISNWKREISCSLNNLEMELSSELYEKLREQIIAEEELILRRGIFSEAIMLEYELYGTYTSVIIESQANEQYRQIAFKLIYFEYICCESSGESREILFVES